MSFHDIIKTVVSERGSEFVLAKGFVSLLADYGAFQAFDDAVYKEILRAAVADGSVKNFCERGKWDATSKKIAKELALSNSFDEDKTLYAFESIAYGLGWTKSAPLTAEQKNTHDDFSNDSAVVRTRFFEYGNGKLRFLEGFSGPDDDFESYDGDTNLIEDLQELVGEEVDGEELYDEVCKLMPEIKEVYFGNVFDIIDADMFCYFDFSNVVKLDFSEAEDLNSIWGFRNLKEVEFVALPDNYDLIPYFFNCPKMKEIHIRTLGNMAKITGNKDGGLFVYVEDEDSELIAPEYRLGKQYAIDFLEDVGDIYLPERLIEEFEDVVACHPSKNKVRIHTLPENYNHLVPLK